jgi:nucleoid-associated protein YgaU
MKRFSVLILFVLLLAGCVGGKGCRPDNPPPPPTATHPAPPTPKVTPTRIPATMTPEPSRIASATSTPVTPTQTPTITPSPSSTVVLVTATPELLGRHVVEQGDTMWDVALWWYRGRFFAWGEDVWMPVCVANPHIANCRLIYPGDVLAIPALP